MYRIMMGFIISLISLSAESSGTTVNLEAFFQNHGFVFFFSSTCPYCHQFSPVIRQIALKLGARVLPLSFDEKPLPEFPSVYQASNAWVMSAYQNEPIRYPALFIANPKTLQLYPVSSGVLTEEEVVERLETLIPRIITYEAN